MEKSALMHNDIQNLLITMEDVIERFYNLSSLDEDDMLQVLGLTFCHRSLTHYFMNFCGKEKSDG